LVLIGNSVSKKLVSVGDQVSTAAPAISVNPSTATDSTGDLITLTAALTGASLDAGGSINFYVTVQSGAPSTCATTQIGTHTVNSNGSYLSSYTPTAAGTYWWYATYSGDPATNNNAANSACGTGMPNTVVSVAAPALKISTVPPTSPEDTDILPAGMVATLTGASNAAAGTITFYVYHVASNAAPGTCPALLGWNTVGTANVVGGQTTYNPNASFAPGAKGDWWWYAAYASSNGYDTSTNSVCDGTMPETVVTGAQPTVTLGIPPTDKTNTAITSANVGGILANATANATGTIKFYVAGPSPTSPGSCTTKLVGTATLSLFTGEGDGTYHPGANFTPTAPGNYWWYAIYSGDANNTTAQTTCGGAGTETIVNTNAPTLTLVSGGAGIPTTDTLTTPTIAGTAIAGTLAAASGGATGSITFYVSGPTTVTTCPAPPPAIPVGTSTVAGNGPYHSSAGYTLTTSGVYWWYAYFTPAVGDTLDTPAASNCVSTIVKTSPTLTVTGPATGTSGTNIAAGSVIATLTGTVGGDATASITYWVYGPGAQPTTGCPSATGGGGGNWHSLGTNNNITGDGPYGYPTILNAYDPTTGGDYWWYGTFSGDNYNNSVPPTTSGACPATMSEMVVQFSPTIALVSGGTGIPTTAGGTDTITTAEFQATLTGANPNPPVAGTITYYASGPTKTSFCDAVTSWTPIGTPVATNTAAQNTPPNYTSNATYALSGGGIYWWKATYNPGTADNTDASATSVCGLATGVSTLVKASPALISFQYPGTGTAGVPETNTGDFSVTLQGSIGDAFGTADIIYYVVGPSATAPTTCTGGTAIGASIVILNDGTYPPIITYWDPTTGGDYWIYAQYTGDNDNNPSCVIATTPTVVKYAPTLALAVPAGPVVPNTVLSGSSFTATLAAASTTASGTITFYETETNGACPSEAATGWTAFATNTTLAGNGQYTANASFTPTTAGTYCWYASYSGDSTDNAAASTVHTTAVQNTPSLTLSTPASATLGSTVLAANINGTLSGANSVQTGDTVTFYISKSTALGTCPSLNNPGNWNTVSTVAVPTTGYNKNYVSGSNRQLTAAGTYWWYAAFSGDADNAAANSPCNSTTVAKATPNMTMPAGVLTTVFGVTTLTFTVTVAPPTGSPGGTPTPSGTVSWSVTVVTPNGTATCANQNLNGAGTAQCAIRIGTANTPAASTYTATANYQGDTNYVAGTVTSPGTKG